MKFNYQQALNNTVTLKIKHDLIYLQLATVILTLCEPDKNKWPCCLRTIVFFTTIWCCARVDWRRFSRNRCPFAFWWTLGAKPTILLFVLLERTQRTMTSLRWTSKSFRLIHRKLLCIQIFFFSNIQHWVFHALRHIWSEK